MSLKSIFTAPSSWFRTHRYEEVGHCGPLLNDEGLIAASLDTEDLDETQSACAPSDPIVVDTVTSLERREPLERLQEGLDKLVDQLQQINDHLNEQVGPVKGFSPGREDQRQPFARKAAFVTARCAVNFHKRE